jgi:hypothetical protein
MIKEMKKIIYMFLVLICNVNGFGQTYTLNLHVYVTKGSASINSNIGGSIYSFTNPNNYGSQDYPFLANVKGNSFTFNLTTNYGSCSQNLSITKSLLEMLRDDLVMQSCSIGSGYAGNFYPLSFVPNGITIQNRNSNNEVCSGEQLELDAISTTIFPNEVYHWQYSLNNKSYWTDVPAIKNNSSSAKFSINDFIGSNIDNYFNKVIYFRLGYGQNKQFTPPIGITFKACGPTVSSISFEGPKCNGDIIKSFAITFQDKLNSAIGENLASISVCDINDNSKIFMHVDGPILYPDGTKTYTYALDDLRRLENGHTYKIRYQAQIPDPKDPTKTIMRGVLESPQTLNFPYKEYEALKFEPPVTKTPPLCHKGLAFIELKVSGGAGDYYYTLDNEIEKKFTNSTTSVIITDPITNINSEKRTGSETIPISSDTPHSIKLRDDNNCIDKTAND